MNRVIIEIYNGGELAPPNTLKNVLMNSAIKCDTLCLFGSIFYFSDK